MTPDSMAALSPGLLAALVGVLGGCVLGLAARMGNFATLSALETAVYARDQRRLRLWGIAVGTAMIAAFLADVTGLTDLRATAVLRSPWNPLASGIGGLALGYGMALAGTCGFGALVRAGGGDLRSLIVALVTGIVGLSALAGPLAPVVQGLFAHPGPAGPDAGVPQGIAYLVSRQTGFSPFAFALVAGLALIGWALAHPPLRGDRRCIGWAVAAGLAVVWCLIGTAVIRGGSVGSVAIEAPSFALPPGQTLLWTLTAVTGGIGFPVGLVAGVLAGGLIGSIVRGRNMPEQPEAPRSLGQMLAGAVLMGIGGTVAGGDAIGQGLSGMAMLAYGAPVTLVALALGVVIGLRRLMGRSAPE